MQILGLHGVQAEFRSVSSQTRRKISRSLKGRRRKRNPYKDPKGGLTAAGRRMYNEKHGSNLKPGVRKKVGQMSPHEMRRKGSWAKRFFGRSNLPPLVKPNGKPTRLALSAAAWGEPVPRSPEAARRIAAKGDALLRRYHRSKGKR